MPKNRRARLTGANIGGVGAFCVTELPVLS